MSRGLVHLILIGVLAGVVGAALTQPLPVPSVPLFAPAGDAQIRAAAMLPEQAGTVRTRFAQLDPVAAMQLRGGALTLNLFEDAAFTAVGGVRTDSAERGFANTLWTGALSGVPHSNVIMLTDAAGNIDLRVLIRGHNYYVQSLGGGLVRISEIDPSAGRYDGNGQPVNDMVNVTPTEAEQREVALNRASPRADDGSIIDVMVVYTPAAVALLGSEAATRLAIEATVALSNVTYENSGVNFRLRLVHLAQVDYVENGSELGRLTGTSDGHMDVVHQWRDQYKADLVALIPGTSVAERNYCGIAHIQVVPNQGFSVTEALCISDITFAHELGHNMGKAHDHAQLGSSGIHPYAYGYQDESTGIGDYGDWVTVMAYSTSPNGIDCPTSYIPGECPAIAWWSDNEATYLGKPLGSPGVNGEDNAQSLNETALTVANYRLSDDGGTTVPTPQPTLTPIPTPGGSTSTLPLNGSFEFDNDDNGTPDGWAWVGTIGKRECGGDSFDGNCTLVLKPGAKIRQTVPLDLGALGQGDVIDVSLHVRPKPSATDCASAKLKVTYIDTGAGANADGKDKLILPLPFAPANLWAAASGTLVLDAAPSSVKLDLRAGGCIKSVVIDDVHVDAEE